jgi:hypothetical protein
MAAITNSNLIENIGLGPNATHTLYPKIKKGMKISYLKKKITHPEKVYINEIADRRSFLGKQFEGIYMYFPFNVARLVYLRIKILLNLIKIFKS